MSKWFYQNVFFLLLVLCMSLGVKAESNDNQNITTQSLTYKLYMEKQQLLNLKKAVDLESAAFRNTPTMTVLGRATSTAKDISSVRSDLGSVQIAITNAKEQALLQRQNIMSIKKQLQRFVLSEDLYKTPKDEILSSLTKQLNISVKRLQLQEARIKNLNQLQKLFKKHLFYINKQIAIFDLEKHRQQLLLEQVTRLNQSHQLEIKEQHLLTQLGQLSKTLDHQTIDHKANIKLELAILAIKERININRLQAFLSALQTRIEPLIGVESMQSRKDLSEEYYQNKIILTETNNIESIITDKIAFIHTQRRQLLNKRNHALLTGEVYTSTARELGGVSQQYQQILNSVIALKGKVKNHQKRLRLLMKHTLSVRQTLPGFSTTAWLKLFKDLSDTPVLLFALMQNLGNQVWQQLDDLHDWRTMILGIFVAIFATIWFGLNRSFLKILKQLDALPTRFSQDVLRIVIRLFQGNLGVLLLLLVFVLLETLLSINVDVWLSLAFVYIGFRAATILARALLVEQITDVAGQDVRLYKGLRRVFVFGCVLTMLTLLTHHLPVTFVVKSLFNRIFMVLLLIFSTLLFLGRRILTILLQKVFFVRRIYIIRALRVFCWLFPLTLLSNAVVGLVGYVQLAWVIGLYQIKALLLLLTYMVLRGLLFDFFELVYEMTIRSIKNGWVWSQVFLKPLDKIMRLFLLLLLFWSLIVVFHLNQNPVFLRYSHVIIFGQLFVIGEAVVNVYLLLQIVLIGALIYWFAKWSRELAFRWIYIKAKDVGVRNSLSVFTQYAVVFFGLLLGLNWLDLNLKGLALVAGLFAAGIGFGFRDIFSNFFSGFLLLIERPFRTGDSITLGEYEGVVVSTGMRSMKIRTWDHMDVIVPNSDMFTKPFTNWTHQDSIVRTVIKVNVDRTDNPHYIQELIYNVVKDLPSVVKDPKPEVFMRDISDALLALEVRYFINLQQEGSRPRVRSEVLFAIWDCFKKHGIRPPFPQNTIFVNAHTEEKGEEKK